MMKMIISGVDSKTLPAADRGGEGCSRALGIPQRTEAPRQPAAVPVSLQVMYSGVKLAPIVRSCPNDM